MTPAELAAGVRAGSQRALARALSVVERGGDTARLLLAELATEGRPPHVTGITGPPGAGKSSLVELLGLEMAERSGRVAVLAVDPSSPFSGGAVLGDRVRMPRLAAREGCFVRSMATRGALGGLTAAAADALDVFAAAGFPEVLVETVGVGQDEVDVVHLADTVVVTLPPGLGDDIQAAKAGVMEIAHVFAVTKADLPGADQAAAHIRAMLELGEPGPWRPPVVPVSAVEGWGITELADAIAGHARHALEDGRQEALRLARARRRLRRAVEDLTWRTLTEDAADGLEEIAAAVAGRRLDPYTAAERLLERLRKP